jgi:hypothetical protein
MNTKAWIENRAFWIAVIALAVAALLVLAAPAEGRSSFYVDVSNSAAEAARGNPAAAAAPAMTIRASHYARLGSLTPAEAANLGNIAPPAAPAAVTLAASHYARLGSLTPAEAASLGNIAPPAAPAMTIRASHYARLGSLTPAEAASLGNIAPPAAPAAATLAASHYARLGSLTPAEAASLGNIAPAAAPASLYTSSSASGEFQSIKTGGVVFAAPGQYQWIRPEGIKASGAKW